jgi:hypothetical protein
MVGLQNRNRILKPVGEQSITGSYGRLDANNPSSNLNVKGADTMSNLGSTKIKLARSNDRLSEQPSKQAKKQETNTQRNTDSRVLAVQGGSTENSENALTRSYNFSPDLTSNNQGAGLSQIETKRKQIY